MNLEPDLQRILNVGAKIYHVKEKRQGKVYSVTDVEVMIDYGRGTSEAYELDEFKKLLVEDTIVANSRVTLGNGTTFQVKPRDKSSAGIVASARSQVQPRPTQSINLEIGYINEKTGRFSKEPKKGYVKIEYKKSTQKVTLEIDDETLEKLKEMGLV